MRNCVFGSINVRNQWTFSVVLAAALFSNAALAQNSQSKGAPAAKSTAAFDPHDLSGKWNRVSPFQTYSNVPGGANELQSFILGQEAAPKKLNVPTVEAPFTPEGKAKFDANIPSYGRRITAPRVGNDPQGNCDPWGVPRMLNGQVAGPHATISIAQLPDKMLVFSQWHHDYREVWADGRKLPNMDEVEPKWNGYSTGHWDGNTFVVESVGFDERTWLDHNGYPHTEDMRLEERYRRIDPDTLELVMTITDPKYYSKPFRSDTKLWKLDRKGGKDWDPQIYCVPSEEFKFNRLIRDGNVGKEGK
jgi:hypothetical protein